MGDPRRWVGIAAVCAVAATGVGFGSSACVLDLPIEIACGDGFVDVAAGEECDPAVPDSYVHACAETSRYLGEGRCDPQTCRIDVSIEACAVCGDGVLDRSMGEDCDLDELGGRICDGGVEAVGCDATCKYVCEACGNGIVDPGEECDPKDLALIAEPPEPEPCAGASPDESLPSLGGKDAYVSGTYQHCNDACYWDRSGCGFCGDGVRDDEVLVDNVKQLRTDAERCDADVIPAALIAEHPAAVDCTPLEAEAGLQSGALRPNLACASDCLSLLDYTGAAPCCIRAGRACTPGDADLRCCYDYATGENGCESATGEGLAADEPRCRPIVSTD